MSWEENRPWAEDSGSSSGSSSRLNLNLSGNKKWLLIIAVLVVSNLVLFYFNSTGGSYLKVMEENLKTDLAGCKDERINMTYRLDACNIDFGICQEGLSNKEAELSACRTGEGQDSAELITCQNSLLTWRDSYDELEGEYLICEGSIESMRDDYDEMALEYAMDKCCEYEYYYVDDHEVFCTNNTMDDTKEFSC